MSEEFKKLDAKIDFLAETMQRGFEVVNKRTDNLESLIDNLAIMTKQGFERVDKRFEKVETRLTSLEKNMDQVVFNTSGLDRRVSTLEDKMRIVSTKLNLGT